MKNTIFIFILTLFSTITIAQERSKKLINQWEIGIIVGKWGETPTVGITFALKNDLLEWEYGKVQVGLLTAISLDFTPYIDKYYNPNNPKSSTNKGVDLRFQFPQVSLGHQWEWKNWRMNNALAIGWASFYTNGTLVNEQYDIERKYKNLDSFLTVGLFNQLGYHFPKKDWTQTVFNYYPLTNRRVYTPYYFGVGMQK